MTRRGETLELAVLGLLHENPMHGYELRKQLNVVLGWGRVLSSCPGRPSAAMWWWAPGRSSRAICPTMRSRSATRRAW